MSDIYSLEYLKRLTKNKTNSIVIFILIIVFALSLNIGLLFLSNENNKIMMIIILSLIFTLAAWLAIWIYIERIMLNSKRIYFVRNILNGESKSVSGKVTEIKKPFTFSKSIRCYEVVIRNEELMNQTIYVDEIVGELPFKEGDQVSFVINKNFAIKYEVLKNE